MQHSCTPSNSLLQNVRIPLIIPISDHESSHTLVHQFSFSRSINLHRKSASPPKFRQCTGIDQSRTTISRPIMKRHKPPQSVHRPYIKTPPSLTVNHPSTNHLTVHHPSKKRPTPVHKPPTRRIRTVGQSHTTLRHFHYSSIKCPQTMPQFIICPPGVFNPSVCPPAQWTTISVGRPWNSTIRIYGSSTKRSQYFHMSNVQTVSVDCSSRKGPFWSLDVLCSTGENNVAGDECMDWEVLTLILIIKNA